jgi:hypothetical protein
MNPLYLEIGGLSFKIKSHSPKISKGIQKELAHFFASKNITKPEINLEIKEKIQEEITSPYLGVKVKSIKDKIYIFQRPDLNGTVILSKPVKASFEIAPRSLILNLNNILRLLLSVILPQWNGLLLHATGVVHKNKAFLFPGPSDTGKTTIAKLLQHETKILADDTVIIREINDCFFAFQTPFNQETGTKERQKPAKICQIYFPEKSHQNKFIIIPPLESLEKFARNIIWFETMSPQRADLLTLGTKIIKKIPCYRMKFTLNNTFWKKITQNNLH